MELNTPNPEKAKAFYSNLFRWQLADVPNPAVPTATKQHLRLVPRCRCAYLNLSHPFYLTSFRGIMHDWRKIASLTMSAVSITF